MNCTVTVKRNGHCTVTETVLCTVQLQLHYSTLYRKSPIQLRALPQPAPPVPAAPALHPTCPTGLPPICRHTLFGFVRVREGYFRVGAWWPFSPVIVGEVRWRGDEPARTCRKPSSGENTLSPRAPGSRLAGISLIEQCCL